MVSECVPNERCLGGRFSNCAPGYTGDFCSRCDTGFFETSALLCEACGSEWVVILLTVSQVRLVRVYVVTGCCLVVCLTYRDIPLCAVHVLVDPCACCVDPVRCCGGPCCVCASFAQVRCPVSPRCSIVLVLCLSFLHECSACHVFV